MFTSKDSKSDEAKITRSLSAAEQQRCRDVLALVGDQWTLAVLIVLQQSPHRFNALRRAVPGLNAVTLSDRLKKLEDAGIVSRTTESESKQSTVYAFTNFGRKLLPIVDALQTVALDLATSEDAG